MLAIDIKVIEAIKAQLDKHLHVMAYGEYIQSAINLLAKNFPSCCLQIELCILRELWHWSQWRRTQTRQTIHGPEQR